ncbi:MAG: hypothetical protein WA756_07120, partial [Pseudolabrys sp.]
MSMTEPLLLCRKQTRGADRSPYLTAILGWDRQQGYWTKGQLKRELNPMSAFSLNDVRFTPKSGHVRCKEGC